MATPRGKATPRQIDKMATPRYFPEGECIYNIIPPKVVIPEKPPLYKSKFNGAAPPTGTTFHTKGSTCPPVMNIGGDMHDKPVGDLSARSMGKPSGASRNDPINYMKKYDKTETVPTLAEVRQSNPEQLQPSVLKPRTRALSGPPKRGEEPIMNLVTKKNFVVANAVEAILATPRKVPDNNKDYMRKCDFGKVPKYLAHIKQDVEAEYAYVRQLQEQRIEEARSQVRPMDEEERLSLLAGMKQKWEHVNTEYQGFTHLTKLDTIGKIKRKEHHESQLAQLEKDIERLARKNIFVAK